MVEFLTMEDVAATLNCALGTVYRLAKKGEFSTYETDIGAAVRSDELAAWMRFRTAGHGPECPQSTLAISQGRGKMLCECVFCHCGDEHQPGGPVDSCRRCHRPRQEDVLARQAKRGRG